MKEKFLNMMHTLNKLVTVYYDFAIAAVLILVLGLSWVLFIGPAYNDIQVADTAGLDEVQKKLQNRQDHLFQLRRLEQEYHNLNQEQLFESTLILPTGYDNIEIMKHLGAFAQIANAEIVSMDIVDSGAVNAKTAANEVATEITFDQKSIHTVDITLNIQPNDVSYQGMKNLLEDIETFAPVLNMTDMSYTPGATSFTLKLESYYVSAE